MPFVTYYNKTLISQKNTCQVIAGQFTKYYILILL